MFVAKLKRFVILSWWHHDEWNEGDNELDTQFFVSDVHSCCFRNCIVACLRWNWLTFLIGKEICIPRFFILERETDVYGINNCDK